MKTLLFFALLLPVFAVTAQPKTASLQEALTSGRDLWGEAAMAQPNGPSYEFFEKLLPPPRYVNADFRYYPIVLSAPEAKIKARLISNGSGINLRGGTRSWNNPGVPFTFRVGTDEFLFGGISSRLSEPVLAEGWLPIPEICYAHTTPYQTGGIVPLNQEKRNAPGEIYRLEAFAATDPVLAENGIVFVKFDLKEGTDGYIAVEPGPDSTSLTKGKLADADGNVLALFDDSWKKEGRLIKARLKPSSPATLAIATKPLRMNTALFLSGSTYDSRRQTCVQTWKEIAARGMQILTPEPLVNNLYRNSVCQLFELINGDKIFYSAGNQYEKLYEAEGSDAALALLAFGYEAEMRRLMIPLFAFTRPGLEYHQAAFKINNLCQYYWYTRDAAALKELRPLWEKEGQLLDKNRTGAGGLYPEEQYCGDIHTFVQSLTVNTQAWRAMRDLGALLAETGQKKEGEHYRKEAAAFRQVVLRAVERAVLPQTDPPFVPIALNGGEPAHDPILHSRIGGYWNLIIGYALRSGIFPAGSAQESWIPHYQEQHGGLMMGMIKSGGTQINFWTGEQGLNPLYGTRYSLDALRRDDPGRALVSFYGMAAQGLTRNTFVGGEGSSIESVDPAGRFFYCPPNSAASAHVLSMLRNLLVQDWDLDDDGRPETLRLGFAVPKQWLEDGKSVEVKEAPTAFGKTSFSIQSHLGAGEITVRYTPPPRPPKKALLRVRVPDKWLLKTVAAGNRQLRMDENGTVDVTSFKAPVLLIFRVVPEPQAAVRNP